MKRAVPYAVKLVVMLRLSHPSCTVIKRRAHMHKSSKSASELFRYASVCIGTYANPRQANAFLNLDLRKQHNMIFEDAKVCSQQLLCRYVN